MPLDMEDWEHCLLPSTFLLEDYVCVRANFMYILLFALTSSVLSDLFWVQILSFFFSQCTFCISVVCLSKTGTQALQRYGSFNR